MPFSLPSPFSITPFNFFCLQVLFTRASLLALAKSIYYSIGNPTLSHVQLCENYIKRARLLWGLKLQVLVFNLIPLRTKLDTQTTVISHRRRKRVSSSAGLLSQSEFSDRRHNMGFCNKSIVFPHFSRKFRGGQPGLLWINFHFRNVIFKPMVFTFVWAKYK